VTLATSVSSSPVGMRGPHDEFDGPGGPSRVPWSSLLLRLVRVRRGDIRQEDGLGGMVDDVPDACTLAQFVLPLVVLDSDHGCHRQGALQSVLLVTVIDVSGVGCDAIEEVGTAAALRRTQVSPSDLARSISVLERALRLLRGVLDAALGFRL